MKNKFFYVIIFLLFMVLALTSCDLVDENNGAINNEDKSSVVYNEDKNVLLNVNENKSAITTTEEAVQKIYSQVVVVNAVSSTASSKGSGVIIGYGEKYSYILTCCHVVDGFDSFNVTLSDGTNIDAYLTGADPLTDLAVLYIEKLNLNYAEMISDASSINIGSECIVIGNPLGTLANSVTKGIISATSRSIMTSDGTYHRLLQTDAAINSGNSGGGLFNNQGQLIGIVSAKYSATGVEGLGFAIPIDTVALVSSELIEKGYVEGRTSLGITFSDGYYRSGFSYRRVVYVSAIDKSGSAYGKISLNSIVDGVSITYKDGNVKTLNSFSTAEEIEDFLNAANLAVGDIVNLKIRKTTNSNTEIVSITLIQYEYK